MLNEFKKFALRGNVLDLAIGIVIGGAFNNIVTSLVKDVIMPPIGLVLGKVNFANLFINLSDKPFTSFSEAQAAGVPTINYGLFLNTIITFLITAFALFFLVRAINKMREGGNKEQKNEDIATTKECPFCKTSISKEATRCPACTSTLQH